MELKFEIDMTVDEIEAAVIDHVVKQFPPQTGYHYEAVVRSFGATVRLVKDE